MLVLALGGLGIAAYLWLLYHRVRAGAGPSFCDLSESWSCSDVARSTWSAFLGVPQAAWGALSYLVVAGLALSAMRRRAPGPPWPGGLLLVVTGVMSAWSVFLTIISERVLEKSCFLCAISWAISFGLLALSATLAWRAGGPGAALRSDLRALGVHRMGTTAAAGALAAAAVALLAGYAASGVPPAAQRAIPVGSPGSLVIYAYSDYLCPYCAVMHEREKTIRAQRPDVRFVRRHFPLDATCNRGVTRTVHEGACDLARGGICAEKQGRFEAYDDVVFDSRGSRAEPDELAARAGLDLAAFRACVAAPETQQRLQSDIQSGLDLQVQGTPSFVVQGKLVSADRLDALLGISPPANP